MDYQKQALDFAKKHSIKLQINGRYYKKHFPTDKDSRWVFNCTLSRFNKQYTFNFGQSTASGSKEPTMYDILTCLQKYPVGTFNDFCGDFGYDNDSITAHRIYKAVAREYKNMERVFGEEVLDLMTEIQ